MSVEQTYHDARADGNGASAVSVGYNVTVTDRQERDRDQPHGVEQVLMLHVVVTSSPQALHAFTKASETEKYRQ